MYVCIYLRPQVAMGLVGATVFAAQGMLAGFSVMQLFVIPRANVSELSLHLAYAPLAVSLQSAVHIYIYIYIASYIDIGLSR